MIKGSYAPFEKQLMQKVIEADVYTALVNQPQAERLAAATDMLRLCALMAEKTYTQDVDSLNHRMAEVSQLWALLKVDTRLTLEEAGLSLKDIGIELQAQAKSTLRRHLTVGKPLGEALKAAMTSIGIEKPSDLREMFPDDVRAEEVSQAVFGVSILSQESPHDSDREEGSSAQGATRGTTAQTLACCNTEGGIWRRHCDGGGCG